MNPKGGSRGHRTPPGRSRQRLRGGRVRRAAASGQQRFPPGGGTAERDSTGAAGREGGGRAAERDRGVPLPSPRRTPNPYSTAGESFVAVIRRRPPVPAGPRRSRAGGGGGRGGGGRRAAAAAVRRRRAAARAPCGAAAAAGPGPARGGALRRAARCRRWPRPLPAPPLFPIGSAVAGWNAAAARVAPDWLNRAATWRAAPRPAPPRTGPAAATTAPAAAIFEPPRPAPPAPAPGGGGPKSAVVPPRPSGFGAAPGSPSRRGPPKRCPRPVIMRCEVAGTPKSQRAESYGAQPRVVPPKKLYIPPPKSRSPRKVVLPKVEPQKSEGSP